MKLFHDHFSGPRQVEIPPAVSFSQQPRYAREAHETKRLKAIAYLGRKWCLAGTRQDFINKLNPPSIV